MKVLIACEESQAVCIEFRKRGHEAYSCDILPCSGGYPEWHIQGDAIKILYSGKWDLVIAHPPCTRLANSGVKHLVRKTPTEGFSWNETLQMYSNDDETIWNDLTDGIRFFNVFVIYGRSGHRVVIENPIQHKYATQYITNRYSQIIQPYQFGHTEKKATCLWIYGLPTLKETNNVYDEMMKLDYKDRAKIHYASPGKNRSKLRSKTFPGIARAMAEQWSADLTIKTH